MSFTPPSSHKSGGLAFTGWTEDGSTPANVESNGGALSLGGGLFNTEGGAIVTAGGVILAQGGNVGTGGGNVDLGGDTDGILLNAVIVTVQAGAPGADYVTAIIVDTTAVSGATYAWDGSAYVKIADLLT